MVPATQYGTLWLVGLGAGTRWMNASCRVRRRRGRYLRLAWGGADTDMGRCGVAKGCGLTSASGGEVFPTGVTSNRDPFGGAKEGCGLKCASGGEVFPTAARADATRVTRMVGSSGSHGACDSGASAYCGASWAQDSPTKGRSGWLCDAGWVSGRDSICCSSGTDGVERGSGARVTRSDETRKSSPPCRRRNVCPVFCSIQ